MARPRVLDDTKKGEIAALLTAGMSMASAARYVGCDRKTIRRERAVDEAFDDRIRRARMASELKPLQAIREAAGKHWRAAAWLLERQDKAKAERRKAKESDKVTLSREQLAKMAVKIKDVALRGITFPEWEADIAQQIDEVFIKFAPALAVPQPRSEEPAETEPDAAEPVQDEPVKDNPVQGNTSTASLFDPSPPHKCSPGIVDKLPDWVRPTRKRSWQESARMLEQMRPDRYGPPAEPEFDAASALDYLRDKIIGILKEKRFGPDDETCGEQREEVGPAEEQKESVNTEVSEQTGDQAT